MAQLTAERAAPVAATIANPGPLGLCGFALTTFVLSSVNAGLVPLAGGLSMVVGLALFYGGAAQFLAGMWEFRTGNTFGATAFTSYGAFWLAVGFSVLQKLVVPGVPFGFFLLGWAIFTGLMLLGALRTNMALIVVFALLFVTYILLALGEFGAGTGQLGGWLGILTALAAWYTALAGLLSSGKSVFTLPVGPRA
jgi:succinate-acetate transporter protein